MEAKRALVCCLLFAVINCAKFSVFKKSNALYLSSSLTDLTTPYMDTYIPNEDGPILHVKNSGTKLIFSCTVTERDMSPQSSDLSNDLTVIWYELKTDLMRNTCTFTFKVVNSYEGAHNWLWLTISFPYGTTPQTKPNLPPNWQVRARSVNSKEMIMNPKNIIKCENSTNTFHHYKYTILLAPDTGQITENDGIIDVPNIIAKTLIPSKVTVDWPDKKIEVLRNEQIDYLIDIKSQTVSVTSTKDTLVITLSERII